MGEKRGRKGFIAATALLIMAILLLVGVAFMSLATTENTMVANEINGQVAFNIAEAGIDHAKRALMGANLNTVLTNGWIVSNASVPFANGTYRLTVNNNQCTGSGCTVMGKPGESGGSATIDTDGRVVVESTGTYTRNGTTATKVIRVLIEIPAILDPPSSIYTLNGPDSNRPTDDTFNGNSFLVQGQDTAPGQTTPISPVVDPRAGLGVMPCPTCSDPNDRPLQEALNSLNPQQTNNITGAGNNPSIAEVSSLITATYLTSLKSYLTAHADVTYSGNTTISSGTLGTATNPQITVVNGDLDLQGPVSGFGILLVTGRFRMRGNATFQGIVLVDGNDGRVELEGNGNKVWGSIIHINRDAGTHSGETRLRIGGNAQVYYSRQAIQDYAGGTVSPTTLAWSERT